MSVQVRDVSKRYGHQYALLNVSFAISPGEIVGFLGPNGAGKSTMMKIITGYIPPTSGYVKVCGLSIHDQGLASRKKIGYLPEHNPLYTDMFVREYLSFIGGMYAIPRLKSRVEELIELVGLTGEAHKKIEALSKGYRQRIGLAQALIHDPEVLILDEPTSGLDPNQLAEIRSLIKTVGKEKTVMLSTHIMQEVEAICSRTIIINKGEIVADRPTQDLLYGSADESYRLVVEFSGAIPVRLLRNLWGIISVSEEGPNTWLLHVQGQKDIRRDLSDLASEHGLTLLTLMRQEMKLEDIFKELTNPGYTEK
jgi:ABC-2 type transport system ATP-binding protein